MFNTELTKKNASLYPGLDPPKLNAQVSDGGSYSVGMITYMILSIVF